MAAVHGCAWRFGGLRSQTSSSSVEMRLATPRRSMSSVNGRSGRHAAPGPHMFHRAAGQLTQAAVHVAEPALAESPTAVGGRSQQLEGFNAAGQLLLKSLTRPQLEGWCAANGARNPQHSSLHLRHRGSQITRTAVPYSVTAGERPQRARQLWRWLYHAQGGWPNDAEHTVHLQNGLSREFVSTMQSKMTFDGGIRLQSVHTASDGTRKLLSTLADGSPSDGLVETVMIPIVRRQVWPPCSHVSLHSSSHSPL